LPRAWHGAIQLGFKPQSTIDDGAKAVLHLVLDKDVGTGGFYNVMVPGKAHPQAYDPEARAKLKALSERILGLR